MANKLNKLVEDDYQSSAMYSYIKYLMTLDEMWDLDDYDVISDIEIDIKSDFHLEVDGGEVMFTITIDTNDKVVISDVRQQVSELKYVEFSDDGYIYIGE